MKVTRYVLPVVVGAMSGMILTVIGNGLIDKLYPPPPGTDKYDADSLNKALQLLPDEGFRLQLVNHATGTLLAAMIATLIAGRNTMRPALVVGFVIMLSGLYYVMNFKLPVWFAVSDMVLYMPLAYLGYMIVRKKSATAAT